MARRKENHRCAIPSTITTSTNPMEDKELPKGIEAELVAAGTATYKVAVGSHHYCCGVGDCSSSCNHSSCNYHTEDGCKDVNSMEEDWECEEEEQEDEDDDDDSDCVTRQYNASSRICRQPSHRKLMLYLGVPLVLLYFLSAQHCTSEVIRLRHPDHLYYGDRGGGGGPLPLRHSGNNYLMEAMATAAERSMEDDDDSEPPSSIYHRPSHNSAVNNHKRKGHSSSKETANSDNFATSNNAYSLPQQQQQQHHHQHHGAIAEERELPVYFARQGNDGGPEVEQQEPAVAGKENEAEKEKPPVEEDGKLFPPDLFTLEQRRQGCVVFYILGVIYMFVALAIVCDEFFVPSLDVIIEFLAIQDDVAGATFMAAGGSAPELFTSVIGVFISKDDVGIGTIVGSAVFNILFVIGMCAIFSKTVLRLTWWPLFRDCSFYSVALITLIFFFRDSYIWWREALILFSIYICYVLFMRFNATFERALKKLLFKNRVTRVSSTDQLVNNKSVNNGASSSQTSVQTVSGNQSSRGSATLKPPLSAQGRRNSIPMLHSGSKFRHGLLQLMIQSIDPLHDGRVDEKATQLHAIASLKALLDAAKAEADTTVTNNSRSKPVSPPQVPPSVQPGDTPLTSADIEDQANGDAPTAQELAALQEAAEEGHEPLDISWPKGDCKKQCSYVLLFPIMILLYLTLPDTRTPRGKKFFAWGFLGSILWIAIFSYFMVWWADRTGETFGIAPEIMGLTFLAAGTSIPDLITSVIVARKGLGDMAVSSSVGSNIFDVCVGLPIPWLLYGIIKGEPVEVSAKGMLCSISILFGMLCFVVLSIMIFRWKMNKGLGLVMFILYFIFLGVSLLFEYNVITCPRFLEG